MRVLGIFTFEKLLHEKQRVLKPIGFEPWCEEMSQLAEQNEWTGPEDAQVSAAPEAENSPSRRSTWLRGEITPAALLATALLIGYAYLFISSISNFWFHPHWTTDDALQQVYPFHEVTYPGLFAGDIVTEVMKGYLAPAHYWISYGVTMLTGGDVIMMSHWVMLIQVVLTLGFFFAAVRAAAGTVPAMVAVTWLLHDRNVMQRLTGGLPRGWSAVVLSAFLCFVVRGNHRAVLITMLIGCLTNPPATLVAALAYGMLLIWRAMVGADDRRRAARRKLLSYLCVAPVFAITTLIVVHRPPQIGQMVSYEQAAKMPEFSRPLGRFPFVPLNPASDELRVVGLEAFVSRFHVPPKYLKQYLPITVGVALLMLALVGAYRRRVTVPAEFVMFGIAALIVYFLSRILAFRLYVPNRHLQIPMALFFIAAFCVGAWRAFHRGTNSVTPTQGSLHDSRLRYSWLSSVALVAVVAFVYIAGGWGFKGSLNFNFQADKKGRVFEWLKNNSPLTSVVAGHPTHIDGTFLFGARRAFITTETGHPFYARYNEEVERRNAISLRAHYARSLEELVTLVEPEGITYFVFRRADFKPGVLPTLTYFPPLEGLMQELVSRPPDQYAYAQLPHTMDRAHYPFVVFIDEQSTLVDIRALKAYLQSQGWTPPVGEGVRALRQLEEQMASTLAGKAVASAPAPTSSKISG